MRIFLLDRKAASINYELRKGLGKFLRNKLNKFVVKQTAESRRQLNVYGLIDDYLRRQWDNQKQAQTSIRNRIVISRLFA
jgi:hypothetical protein